MALSPRRRFTPAFSLIEVVVAIGIVAFALVAIASTLPVGLTSLRDSQNDQAVATVQNQLRGELEQISFNENDTNAVYHLTDLPTTNYYYTAEGVKTTTNTSSSNLPPYYMAQFWVTNAGVNGVAYDTTNGINQPDNAAVVTVALISPYPTLTQTNRFSMFVTRQKGN